MGRKSLAAERREQILDAFAICLRKYGFEGATLERIAAEAGVQRSIIRIPDACTITGNCCRYCRVIPAPRRTN